METIYTIKNLLSIKKIYVISILLLCCFFNTQSQDTIQLYRPAKSISLFIGDGIPIGPYGANKGTDYGEFALHGIAWGISADIPIKHSHWGITIEGLKYDNRFNQDTLGKNLIKEKYLNYQIEPWDKYLSNEYYRGLILMAGLYYSIHLNNICFELKVLTGYGIYSFPEFGYGYATYGSAYSTSSATEYDIAASNSEAFAIEGGVKMQSFFAKSKLGIELNIDFFYANPLLTTTETVYTPSGYAQMSPSSTTIIKSYIPISQVIATIGLCYRFIKL